MGAWQRLKVIFGAKANKALDRAEDPRETLDYAYSRQLELLQKVRRGVADVATSRKRLELQLAQLENQSGKMHDSAQKALTMGREDLAREALTRRSGLTQQMEDLRAQHAALQSEEERLTSASRQLQAKVEAFRTRKETIKATYTAAEAQSKIGEAFSGLSTELGDVGAAVQRAEDRTAQLQARSGAIDELLSSGALDDSTGTQKDDITAELERLASSSDVESELASMKAQLVAPERPREIDASAGAAEATVVETGTGSAGAGEPAPVEASPVEAGATPEQARRPDGEVGRA